MQTQDWLLPTKKTPGKTEPQNFAGILNQNIAAVQSLNAGAEPPPYAIDHMLWLDTSARTIPILKMRLGSEWLVLMEFDALEQRAHTPDGVPPGTYIDFAGRTAPSGYLKCDGKSYLVSDYPALHDAIGFAYGGAVETGTFNVPNIHRGGLFRRPVNGERAIGSYQEASVGPHVHPVEVASAGDHKHRMRAFEKGGLDRGRGAGTRNRLEGLGRGAKGGNTELAGEHVHEITILPNEGTETVPRNIGVLTCIKY